MSVWTQKKTHDAAPSRLLARFGCSDEAGCLLPASATPAHNSGARCVPVPCVAKLALAVGLACAIALGYSQIGSRAAATLSIGSADGAVGLQDSQLPQVGADIPAAMSSPPRRGAESKANATCSYRGSVWTEYIDLHKKVRADLELGQEGIALVWHCTAAERCCGLKDNMQGIAGALYAAMLTRRALFIQWERQGEDFAELMGMSEIDLRPPALLLRNCTTEMHPIQEANMHPWDIVASEHLVPLLLQMNKTSCIRVKTNANPPGAVLGVTDGAPASVEAVRKALIETVPERYLLGCALHFLFNFVPTFAGLANSVALLASTENPIPDHFVAVHLRFGDDVMHGKDTHNFTAIVRQALVCARALAKDIFSSGAKWGIFVASDSVNARRYAMEAVTGINLFMAAEEPKHLDQQTANIWGSLGDFLLLTKAQGMVHWSGEGYHLVNGSVIEISGFSDLAAEMNFLPADHRRVVGRQVRDLPVCMGPPR